MSVELEDNINGFGDGSGSGGGSIGTGAYNVKVIDYDGTVIAEQNLDEGKSFKLPKAPKHEGLVFQEWSATQDVIDGKIIIGKTDVMVGAIYTTASGKNEFDVEVNALTGLTVTLKIDGTKDWGDGSTPDTETSHTYSQAGKYTIKTDGTVLTSASGSGVFNQNNTDRNYYCTAIRLATITDIPLYAFYSCFSLKYITLSNKLLNIGAAAFASDYINALVLPATITTLYGLVSQVFSLKYLFIPNSVTTIIGSALSGLQSLRLSVIPNSVTSLGATSCYNIWPNKVMCVGTGVKDILTNTFKQNYGLEKIVFLGNVETIATTAFNANAHITEYDFSKCTAVPTLSNIDAFAGINPLCKIKVPSALYEDWIAEANWVTYEDYIVAV